VSTPDGAASLHDWLYARVQSICFDREYLYRSFVEHFCVVMGQVYARGSVAGEGAYEIPGIKSGLRMSLRWSLAHQLSFQGPNPLRLRYAVSVGEGGPIVEEGEARFDLSTGARLGATNGSAVQR
jgi:hypothetical protein